MTAIHLLLSRGQQNPHSLYWSNEFYTILRALAKTATSLKITYGAGLSALHQVCQLQVHELGFSRPSALEILLQEGADPKLQNKMGETALTCLVEHWKKCITTNKYFEITPVTMIKKILDSLTDEYYRSAVCADPQILSLSLISQNEELAYQVLKYSPSVDAIVYDIFGLSSLEAACQYGCSHQMLKELLGRSKIDRAIAGSKHGLLAVACKGNEAKRSTNKATVIDLLDLGFDPNDRTTNGQSAMMLAAEAGDLAVVDILVQHGADVSAIDYCGWSVIHYALRSGDEKLWDYLQRIVPDWNATISVVFLGDRSEDATALHLAAGLDNGAFDFLLRNRLISEINHVTNFQETALYIAILHNLSRNVELLLKASADTTLSSIAERSLLHLAARHGLIKIVNSLANSGANLLLRDISGFTPELVARKNGHTEVANYLKKRTSNGDGNRSLPCIMRARLKSYDQQKSGRSLASNEQEFLLSPSAWPSS